jgi:hypothetical protein
MKRTTEQGLVPASRVVEGEIVSADAYNTQVAAWRESGLNVLTPAVALSSIPTDHKIIVSRVLINPNPAGGEVYQNPLFTKNGEVALAKPGLEKLAQCAGISIDEIERVDSRTVPHVWSYRVYGHWIGFDGSRIDRVATKSLDLRDGSPDIKGFTPNQVEQARRHGEAVCESKAINRLYRQYGLRQKYQQQELAERPFIVLKLQWEPDMTNPVVAALLTQMRAGATRLMFPEGLAGAIDPKGLPAHQVPPEMRPKGETKDVDDDEDETPQTSTTPQERSFDDVEAEDAAAQSKAKKADERLKVMGVTARGDDYYVTVSNGQTLHTKDKAIAKICNDARKADKGIDIDAERRGNVIEIVAVDASDAGY